MGEKKIKVIDVDSETRLNRSFITLVYKETILRLILEVIDKFCDQFDCKVKLRYLMIYLKCFR